MKLKSLMFLSCLCFLPSAFASNNHLFHPKANSNETSLPTPKSAGVCDIEIINDSFDDIRVYGRFDDGSALIPFVIKHWGAPIYVSLFYYGACHLGMDFYIETTDGKHKYNGFTPVGKTIKIKSY